MSSSRQPRPASPPPAAAGTFIDWGPALPAEHGVTRVVALVRDPERFFVFWEGGDTIRARALPDGSVREHEVSWAGSWYFEGKPEAEYEVDLLLQGKVAAVSNRIRLPRREPAASVDPEWVPTPEQLELLRGLAGSLEVLMREETEAINSEILRRRPGGTPWPSSPGRR